MWRGEDSNNVAVIGNAIDLMKIFPSGPKTPPKNLSLAEMMDEKATVENVFVTGSSVNSPILSALWGMK